MYQGQISQVVCCLFCHVSDYSGTIFLKYLKIIAVTDKRNLKRMVLKLLFSKSVDISGGAFFVGLFCYLRHLVCFYSFRHLEQKIGSEFLKEKNCIDSEKKPERPQ